MIAETASSHEGRVDIAKKMADAAAAAGADAIKFQMLDADSLLVPGHHKYKSFKEIQFSEREWRDIIAYARSTGLCIIAEIFDDKSFVLAEQLNIDIYKVPTSDLTNPFLLSGMAASGKFVILSVGSATEAEIEFAVKAFESKGNKNLALMHGFQNFPTKIEDTKFRLLDFLKRRYPYYIGFADHVDAESELALVLPAAAIGYGASIIEKHITLDRSLKKRDYYSALDPREFSRMVGLIRGVEKAYGSPGSGHSPAEAAYRKLMKKKIVAGRNIAKGQMIRMEDIMFRRTDEDGLIPGEYQKILRQAKKIMPEYSVIREEDVD